MAASVTLIAPDGREEVSLGEIMAPESMDGIGAGDPVRLRGVNNGTTKLRNISIGVEGPVAQFIQLARDEEGTFGAWTETEGSIVIEPEEVLPGEKFWFWAIAVYTAKDAEGHYAGDFVLSAVSVGA